MSKAKIVVMSCIVLLALSLLGFAALAAPGGEPGGSSDPLVTQSYVDKYVQWNVAELKTGQTLQGGAGSEFILRRGQASVVDPLGNGIPDVTAGVDIYAGGSVPLNHLLVIPREDGRGIKAKVPVVVMYRGGAEVQ